MIDREKVIKGLQIERECVARDCDRDCRTCDLAKEWEWLLSVYDDALELLKEQEPKTVLNRDDGYYCPQCSTIATRIMGVQKLHPGTRYCPYCGQAVKWEC